MKHKSPNFNIKYDNKNQRKCNVYFSVVNCRHFKQYSTVIADRKTELITFVTNVPKTSSCLYVTCNLIMLHFLHTRC